MRTLLSALTLVLVAAAGAAPDDSDLLKARDHQDRAALEKIAEESRVSADKQPNDAAAQYRLALAESYAAEVSIELHDKAGAKNACSHCGHPTAYRATVPPAVLVQRLLHNKIPCIRKVSAVQIL